MTALPEWHEGRITIPWWYVPGRWLISLGITGAVIGGIHMEPLETTIVAAVICSAVGALAYIILTSLARYKKQRTDAEKLRSKIAAEGRDPMDPAQLSAAERWELTKAQKFDRIFIAVGIIGTILATAAATGVLHVFGPNWIAPEWQNYAIVGGILGIIAAWIFDQTIIDAIATCTWQDKTAKAFRAVEAVAIEAAKSSSVLDEIIDRYTAAGFSAKEAKEMAKEYLLSHPEALPAEE
jgi:uncharacterized membrane protein YeaQ/YmgE (transglycosylase-associated protein family)